MKQLYTHFTKKLFAPLLLLLLFTCITELAQAQDVIFNETVGNGPGKSIVDYQAEKRFDYNAADAVPQLVYSGTGSVSRDASSNYVSASGRNNILLLPGRTFEISGINTLEYQELSLSFGSLRSAGASNLLLEVSYDDGVNWIELFVGGFKGSDNTWDSYVVNREAGNDEAILLQAEKVRFRFTNPAISGAQMRIDDVKLVGILLDKLQPKVTSFSPTEGGVGTLVTITGTDLSTVERISFETGFGPTRIVTKSDTEIVFEVLEGASTDRLALYSPLLGDLPLITEQTFTFVQPYIEYFENEEGVSITHAPVGSKVRLIGADLISAQTVIFEGGISVVPTVISDTELEVIVPEGAVTGVLEVITSKYGKGSSFEDLYIPRIEFTGAEALTTFITTVGTPSEPQSYIVSGFDLDRVLDKKLSLYAPLNFEISHNGNEGTWVNSQNSPLTFQVANNKTVAPTTIFIRYNPSAAGTHNESIVHVSSTLTVRLEVAGTSTSPNPFPVELISFTAKKQQGGVMLKWETASEKDNAYFDVEMSANSEQSFTKVARVDSKVTNSTVNTAYQYKHNNGPNGTRRYYRLKQVDLDGTSSYSKIVAVEAEAAIVGDVVKVAPNPLNYNSKVFINAEAAGKATIRLHAATGQQVYFKDVDVSQGENQVQLPLYDKLTNGVYILRVELNGEQYQVKLIKQ